MIGKATVRSPSNIAFIKYWGNQDDLLRIPANGSISMNLAGLETRTTVSFDTDLDTDQLLLNGEDASGPALERVSECLDRIRTLADLKTRARVESSNSFPTGTGIASSASAFAALVLAGTTSLGLELTTEELSRLARTGSGSAGRGRISPGRGKVPPTWPCAWPLRKAGARSDGRIATFLSHRKEPRWLIV